MTPRAQWPAGWSLDRKLPALVGGLLLIVVLVLSGAAYEEVRRAARLIAATRIERAATEFASLFQRSTAPRLTETRALARHTAIVGLLERGTGGEGADVRQALASVVANAPTARVEVQDPTGRVLARGGDTVVRAGAPVAGLGDSGGIGPMRLVRDSVVYYEVRVPVRSGDRTVGQLVQVRRLTMSQQGRQTIRQLVGGDVDLLIGNADGPPWTDLASVVPAPPAPTRAARAATEYHREEAKLGAAAPIGATPWLVLVDAPRAQVYAAADAYFRRMAAIAAVVVLLGGLGAWWVSRRITTPLKRLTLAAEGIAGGDLDQRVPVVGRDEPGRLASAFNAMAEHVARAQRGLEAQVAERTGQLEAANRKLARDAEELEAANKELEAFSYSVSHDLRAPLRAIHGFARILMEDHAGELAPEARRLLGVIDDNTRRMGELIDDLLAFSRLGRKELEVADVDVTEVMQTVLEELRRAHPDAVPPITIDPLPTARGDRALLRQAFANLLDNAVKFTRGRPGARITIGAQRGDNGHQVYYVRDNGVGFDMRYAGKLFGVFQRLHADTEFEGTGVGLATVQRIVHRHGGRTWAEGAVGEGATFYLSLPGNAEG